MTDVLTMIDWTRRPADTDGPPGPVTFDVVGTHGGNWTIVPRVPGEILTASKYNADRQAAVDNDTPLSIDDYSNTLAEMQAETNPYPGGAPSQPTSLAGELERIRWVLHQLNPAAPAWYAVPPTGLSLGSITVAQLTVTGNATVTGSVEADLFVVANSDAYWSRLVNGTPIPLLLINNADNLHLGNTLPITSSIVLGSGGLVQAGGLFHATAGAWIQGRLTLTKDEWVYWGDRQGIAVGSDNQLHLGLNCVGVTIWPPVAVTQTLNVGTTLHMFKDQWMYWGDKPTLRVNASNMVDLGFQAAGLTVYPATAFQAAISVNGNVTITKNSWVMGGDIQMTAVSSSDNSVHVGTNATVIRLNRPTYVTGELFTTGDVIIGAGGGGNLTARNTLKAWARATTSPAALVGGANVLSVVSVGMGTVRLTLVPGAPGWAGAVATAEGPTHICSTTLLDPSTVDVILHDLTGSLVNGAFCVAMF